MTKTRAFRAFVAMVALAAGTLASMPAHAAPVARLVGPGLVGGQYATIQAAVNAAEPGDWIMIWPGTYNERVVVEKNNIHIRGMDRNGVIIDGEKQRSNGISVYDVTGSWVENLTATNFNSNAIYWSNVDGYWGSYLTGNDSNYGVFAFDSTGPVEGKSLIYKSYATGNTDSGFYIGGCQPCHAVISDVLSERNTLGYSGTNAGGDLTIMNSEWRNNYAGIVPNVLPSEPYMPQRGALIYNNYVHHNNDNNAPAAGGIAGLAPVGVGIEIAGGWANVIEKNRVLDHKHYGILLHWLITPATANAVIDNVVDGSADADLANEFTGIENCFTGNETLTGGEPTSDPPMIQDLYSCENPATGFGSPIVSLLTALNAAGITEPRNPGGGATPPALESMANPCAGAPDSPWCFGGQPA